MRLIRPGLTVAKLFFKLLLTPDAELRLKYTVPSIVGSRQGVTNQFGIDGDRLQRFLANRLDVRFTRLRI